MQPFTPNRPGAAAIYRKPRSTPQPNLPQQGFSEMLTVLLAMTLTDGMADKTLFSLLKDVLPYAEPQDRERIRGMLGLSRAMQSSPADHRASFGPLSPAERLLGLLNKLKKYCRKDTADRFTLLERSIRMQQRVEQSGGDLMPLVMESLGINPEMLQMLNMMQSFGGGISETTP